MTAPCYGFRIVGATTGGRRLINWAAAFHGYATCAAQAEVNREAYLSAFTFGTDFRSHLEQHGTTKGYTGPCWSPWLWFDIDRDGDLPAALLDARRLAATIDERYKLAEDTLLLFYSGSKGFHVGLPTALWQPSPSTTFNRVARQFAETIAAGAGVTIDTGVYDKVRAFRAPNSRHPKTGLHKRRFSLDELMHLSIDAIIEAAKEPEPFDLPVTVHRCDLAAADWQAGVGQVEQQIAALSISRATSNAAPTLNRSTLAFIRDGARTGDRHRLLYSAAANLAEFGCPMALAHALLTEAALDCGLPPKEVHRQIECGLSDAGGARDE